MIKVWDIGFELHGQALVRDVVDRRGPERLKAWQSLLAAVAPHVERWATRNPTLRALRLTSEDEARAVLVKVVERLERGQHQNLRAFLEARGAVLGAAAQADEEGRALHRFAAIAVAAGLCEEDGQDDVQETPLRAWLKGLTGFAAQDHAASRLGRGNSMHTPGDTAPVDKRRVNSDARRITESDVGSVRPPITDLLTLKRIAGEIWSFAEKSFSPELQRALDLRLDDCSYQEIARELRLRSAGEAQQLVRAAKERLRAEFRHQQERFGIEE